MLATASNSALLRRLRVLEASDSSREPRRLSTLARRVVTAAVVFMLERPIGIDCFNNN